MATFGDIVDAALSDLGVRAAGEVLTASESADGLVALNDLRDQWETERLAIYTVTRTTWTISANDGEYTVGSGANVNVARPVFVDHVNFIDTSTTPDTEYPLKKWELADYAAQPQKALTSTFPQAWYYNPTYPTGTLTLWPVPTSSTLEGAIYTPVAVASFASLSTTVSLPPGYKRALVKNLALELAPSYLGREGPSPLLIQQARESKAAIKRANQRAVELSFESAVSSPGAWNIRTGQ